MTLAEKIGLIQAKIEIMKLKHDSYQWCCSFNDAERADLEKTLVEINETLKGAV